MFDLKDLYQEIIVDHNRSPRNFRVIENADLTAEGYNPLCGDKLTVYLKLDGDVITDVSFQGDGCAISVASASLMTDQLMGKTEAEAGKIFSTFHELVTDRDSEINLEDVGKLGALAGVRDFPARVKCATLCWHTMNSALVDHNNKNQGNKGHATISTE